jgi:hypothetical protein
MMPQRLAGRLISRAPLYNQPMCRNIRTLYNFEPPASEDEIRDAALQYVRKISGTRKPSRANQATFDRGVDEVTAATARLVADLITTAAPRNRDVELTKARAKWEGRRAEAR